MGTGPGALRGRRVRLPRLVLAGPGRLPATERFGPAAALGARRLTRVGQGWREVDADPGPGRDGLLGHRVAPVTLDAPAHDDQVAGGDGQRHARAALGGLDEEAPGGAEAEHGHGAGFLDLADRVSVPAGRVAVGAVQSPWYISGPESPVDVAEGVSAGDRVVGAGRENLGRGLAGQGVGGLGDRLAQADPPDAGSPQRRDVRRSGAGHDVDRQGDFAGQGGQDGQVEQPGHEQAVRAGLRVGGGAGQHVLEASGGLADLEQEHVGAGVDHELGQSRVGGGRAGGADARSLGRGVEQAAAGAPLSSRLIPTAPAPIIAATVAATAPGSLP